MIQALIKSQTRRKLLIKFFVNIANYGYLNQLAEEFSESTNSVRKELNNLTEARYLSRKIEGNKVIYKANVNHPLFNEIQDLVKKSLGIEQMINTVLDRMGNVHEIYLLNDFAKGINTNQIDILITGNNLNTEYITEIEDKLHSMLNKKFVILTSKTSLVKVDKLLVFRNY